MRNLLDRISSYLQTQTLPDNPLTIIDVVEIIIIAVFLYYILMWAKNSRAWNLFKGILVILIFVLIAVIFQMNTILWIAKNTVNVIVIALVIIFQPELRSALENLGGRSKFGRLFSFGRTDESRYSERMVDELVTACFAMGRVRTGALIVLEGKINLDEYIRTGIDVDAILTSQLLINIFEKNTPLHDGAVIVRGERVASATCYLPLSDSQSISKELGTRHRAAVGISEVSDSLTIVVSEETGRVSVAAGGVIEVKKNPDELRASLIGHQTAQLQQTGRRKSRRRIRNAQKDSKNPDQ